MSDKSRVLGGVFKAMIDPKAPFLISSHLCLGAKHAVDVNIRILIDNKSMASNAISLRLRRSSRGESHHVRV